MLVLNRKKGGKMLLAHVDLCPVCSSDNIKEYEGYYCSLCRDCGKLFKSI